MAAAPAPPPRRGLLLINLGTPDAPYAGPVRRYLREFLSDPRVIDLSPLGRWLLLNLIILPIRPARSAEAYRKVWTERGSPLLFHSQDLTEKVAQALKGEFAVELAMRYGRPSISDGLERLTQAGVQELTVLPLYPLEAASSTSTSRARVYELLGERWDVLPTRVVPPFFDHPGFLHAFTEVARPALATAQADHVLFSFHGVPERHVRKSDPSGAHCLGSPACCDALGEVNRGCYRAQSFFVARALASRLGLGEADYSVSFQSRLGRTPWIKPYTDLLFPELVAKGVKRLAVFCPSFVADCLETLEEIAIRGREAFLAAGGEELTLVPSLNSSPGWVRAVTELVRSA